LLAQVRRTCAYGAAVSGRAPLILNSVEHQAEHR
jgi:hypothetical protein